MQIALKQYAIFMTVFFTIYFPMAIASFWEKDLYGAGIGALFMALILSFKKERRRLNMILDTMPLVWGLFMSVACVFWGLMFMIIEAEINNLDKFALIMGNIILYFFIWAMLFLTMGDPIFKELESMKEKLSD